MASRVGLRHPKGAERDARGPMIPRKKPDENTPLARSKLAEFYRGKSAECVRLASAGTDQATRDNGTCSPRVEGKAAAADHGGRPPGTQRTSGEGRHRNQRTIVTT